MLSNPERIRNVLATTDRPHLPAYVLAARSGVSPENTQRCLDKMIKAGKVSRDKPVGSKKYVYWLDDHQLDLHLGMIQIPGSAKKVATDPMEIPAKLRFLRDLQARPVFADHAILAKIVKDYERTLKVAVARSEAA